MTPEQRRLIDAAIHRELEAADSDVEGRPIHYPIIRDAAKRVRRKGGEWPATDTLERWVRERFYEICY